MSYHFTSLNYKNYRSRNFLKLLILVLCISSIKLYSQDPSFSQFTANKLFYNPAYVGINEEIEIHSQYRRYLTRIPSKFESSYFSFDFPFNMGRPLGLGGVGLVIFKNSEGDGHLTTSMIGIPFSTQISNARSGGSQPRKTLHFGVTPSIVFKSINWDNLIFAGQLNKLSGYDPNLPRPSYIHQGVENLRPYPDFSFGIYFQRLSDPTAQANVLTNVFEMGISFHHFPLDINHSFTDGYAPLPTKFAGVIKYTFPVNWSQFRQVLVQPAIIVEKQASMHTMQFNTLVYNNYILFGIGLRQDQYELIRFNNSTISAGFSHLFDRYNQKRLWVIISVDWPFESRYTLVNSSYEISINFRTPYGTKCACRNFGK